MTNQFWTQLRHESLLARRSIQDVINPLLFFILISCLLPLAVGSDAQLMSQLGGGMIWVIALLASLLSLDHLFRSDFEDGFLDQMLLLPEGLFWPVLAKVISHWLLTGLPVAIVSPLLGYMFALSPVACVWLLPSLLLGTLAFSLIGAIGSALTVSLKKGGLLLSLIIIPLYIPVLIFGAGIMSRVDGGYNVSGLMAVLASITTFALALGPLAISSALRIGADG